MSYGSISYLPNFKHWEIDCTGQVRNLLKRIFPNVNQFEMKSIRISDNPENCRDILWFIDRYPMTVNNLKKLKAGAKEHVDIQNKVNDLLSFIKSPEDFELALPPREYQKIAASLCELKKGLLLGDKVGLGKSISAICPMASQKNLPVLVVTLTHLTGQWEKYLHKFAPQLKTHILKTGKPYDLVPRKSKQVGLFEEPALPDVIICNYHKLHGWVDVLTGLVKYVVFDECQELRRDESLKYVAAKEIADKAELKMGLSATPIYNYGAELFNVFDVLLPDSLGTREEFYREWCYDQKLKDPKAFGDYLRREGLMLVRTRKDVGRELPPTNKIVHQIEADIGQLSKIQSSASELARVIVNSNQSYRNEKFHASGEFNVMLRHATGLAKAPYVADFVRMLMDSEEKIILYGWHHDVYALWMEALKEFNPRMYTGQESPNQKEENKQAFIHGDCRVLIISLRAGAGLDGLQEVCRVGVFGELDWSSGVHTQCIGRYDREPESGILDELGPAFAYFLVSDEGSDPVMVDILGLKQAQIDGVIEENPELVEELQVDPNHIKRLAEDYLSKHKSHSFA